MYATNDALNKGTINSQNYNSFDAPENNFEVKRVINHINDQKRVQAQRPRHSYLESANLQINSESRSMQFYLNREKISEPLNTSKNEIIPINNDWQKKEIIPTLSNGLDLILKNPGIFPVESINHYNSGKLGDFFTRLPQYSQINEECISPYYSPG